MHMEAMSDVLQGKVGAAKGCEQTDGIMDDGAWAAEGGANATLPVAVFKVLHTNPKKQKLSRTIISGLRMDHVAVASYVVTGTAATKSQVSIQGNHLDGRLDSVRLLSLDNFIQYGSEKLRNEMGVCESSASINYSFKGVSLPPLGHSAAGHAALTDLVNANAYPGPWCTWISARKCSSECMDVLRIFEGAGLVTQVKANHWQASRRGLEVMQWDRTLVSFKRFFQRRQVLMDNWTTFELCDYLEEQGWVLQPFVPRAKLAPLAITDDAVPVGCRIFYYCPEKLEFNRSYLECLADLPTLRAKGVRSILHKGSKAYYEQLLGRYVESANAILDDDPLANLKIVKTRVGACEENRVIPAQLALEDAGGAEEYGSSEDDDDSRLVAATEGGLHEIVHFGPFPIRAQQRQTTAGHTYYQWEATCKFHRDPMDHPNTMCKKTCRWLTLSQKDEVLSQLKNWCLQGRGCSSRAIAPHGHKFKNPPDLPALPHDKLDKLIEWALKQPSWVVQRDHEEQKSSHVVLGDGEPQSSPSSSSSSSSSDSAGD